VRDTLNHYLSDRASGKFGFHVGTIEAPGQLRRPAATRP